MLGRALIALKFADPALTMNLLSALCAAGVTAALLLIYREIRGQLTCGALIAAGTMAFGGCLWTQAVRAEVYAPAMLSACLALYLIIRLKKTGSAYYITAAAYFWAITAVSHSAIAAAILLPLLYLLATGVGRRKNEIPSLITALVLVISAGTIFLYLPIRGGLEPEINWGGVNTLSGLWSMMTSREFAFSMELGGWKEFSRRLGVHWKLIYANFPMFLSVLALWGIWRSRKELWLILLFILGSSIALIRQELPHPDHLGYLLPAVMAAAIWTGSGFDGVVEWIKRQRLIKLRNISVRIITIALILFLLLPLIAAQYPVQNLRGNRWAERLGRDILESLPQNSLIMFADVSSYFICRYLQVVEGVRSDCAVIFPGLLSGGSLSRDWYRSQLIAQGTVSGLEGELPEGEIGVIARIIEANHRSKSLFCEYGENYRPFNRYFTPQGLVFRINLPGDSIALSESEDKFYLKSDFGRDRGAALAYAARLYQRGLFYADAGQGAEASEAFYRAKILAESY